MIVINKIPLIAVVGPTASGKTGLGVSLALRFNGEVVSADSMQIYRGMPIATAQPSVQEMRGVPHRLMGFLDASEPFSVADYVKLAHAEISDMHSRGVLPILVGGTGLYVTSLLDNISFTQTPVNHERRSFYSQLAQSEGNSVLWERLKAIDPESAEQIHFNNVGRVVRALEFYDSTGITLTEQKRRSRLAPSPYKPLVLGLSFREREKLYVRIDRRVDEMLAAGLLDEARAYVNNPQLPTSGQAIGYKELAPYFNGEITLDEAIENLKRETRRYAKRQLTWFRRDERVNRLYVDDYETFAQLEQHAASLTEKFIEEC